MNKIEEAPNILWNIICNIAKNVVNNQKNLLMFNERYLHHYFSKEVQNNGIDLNICGGNIMIFPEWPTFKKYREKNFAKYKCIKEKANNEENIKKKCIPTKDINKNYGSAGFIDFAIGSYNAPKIGIEFKYLTDWNNEAVTFDFLKLADKRNPFEVAIWFGLIFRENGFSKKLTEKIFRSAFCEALDRLNNIEDNKKRTLERTMFICALEVDNNNKRVCFLCEKNDNESFSFKKISENIENEVNNYKGFKL